jgi:DNA gyrase/topoisomerase IV subunit A
MTQADRQSENVRRLRLLEAELIAATRAHEVITIAQRAPSSKVAVAQVMDAFSLSEEQAVAILDSQFRVTTSAARERIEEEIRALRASVE